jgi:hypothetical protein
VEAHRSAERRSLALHSAIAERLLEDRAPIELARARVAAWRAGGHVHREYVDAWADLLASPLADVCALLVDPGERGCAMRQVSPFAGALSARERWRIIKSVPVHAAG